VWGNVPSDDGGNTSHGFRFRAPVGRYLYVLVKDGVEGTGGLRQVGGAERRGAVGGLRGRHDEGGECHGAGNATIEPTDVAPFTGRRGLDWR